MIDPLEEAYFNERKPSDADLIAMHLASKGAYVAPRPAFAQGSEMKTSERKLIRRDWKRR